MWAFPVQLRWEPELSGRWGGIELETERVKRPCPPSSCGPCGWVTEKVT